MARLKYSGSEYWPEVECTGCGATRSWLPSMLDSRIRGITPFDKEHAKLGTSAGVIAEFSLEHSSCPEPRVEVTESGITVVDKRVV